MNNLQNLNWEDFATTYCLKFPYPIPHNPDFIRDFEIQRCEQRDGSQKWKVKSGPAVLGKTKIDWCFEPIPSSRTEEFLKECRFDTKEEAYKTLMQWFEKGDDMWGYLYPEDYFEEEVKQ